MTTQSLLWILSAVTPVVSLLAVLLCMRPQRLTARKAESSEACSSVATENDKRNHSLTVVCYCFTAFDTLGEYLEQLMNQTYDNYNVVLVCDASAQATQEIEETYQSLYPNLYVTYIPPGSHNLSRRKLAATVGIKAAKGEYVLTTLCNAIIPSDQWLSRMMHHINEGKGKQIVLGYSHQDFHELRGSKRLYRQFLTVMSASTWLGYAIAGKPFRGDNNNLLFRRDMFFAEKGYSSSTYLTNGDDDIFLSRIADGGNTAVELSAESILTTKWQSSADSVWRDRKEGYDFTSHYLRRTPFLLQGLLSTFQWLALICTGLAFCIGLFAFQGNNYTMTSDVIYTVLIPVMIAIIFFIEMLLSETIIYRSTAQALQATRLWWSLPLFMLWRPLGNFLFRLRHRSSRSHNFTYR